MALDWLLLCSVFAAAYLQDCFFTAKTALVAHHRLILATVSDAVAMLAATLYTVLAAATAITTGISPQTLASFLAIMVGGGLGTSSGMLLSVWLEKRFGTPIAHHLRPRLWLPTMPGWKRG